MSLKTIDGAVEALGRMQAPLRFVDEGADVVLVNASNGQVARYQLGQLSQTTRDTVEAINALTFLVNGFKLLQQADVGLPWELKAAGEWLIVDRHGNTVVDCSGDFERRGDQSLAEARAGFVLGMANLVRAIFPEIDKRAAAERAERERVENIIARRVRASVSAPFVAGFDMSEGERSDLADRLRKALRTLVGRPVGSEVEDEATRIIVETANAYIRDVNERCVKEGKPPRFPAPAAAPIVEPPVPPPASAVDDATSREAAHHAQLSEIIGALAEQSRVLDEIRRVLTSHGERLGRVENSRESLIGRLERLETASAARAEDPPDAAALVAKMEAAATAKAEGRPAP